MIAAVDSIITGKDSTMSPMSYEDYQEAKEMAAALPNHVKAVRDSFHSLIGDFWVKGFCLDKIKSANKDHGHAPILHLWDSDIPLPNPQTALAWLLTCEFDPFAPRPRIIIPESVDPFHWQGQMECYDSTVRPSPKACEIKNLRVRLSTDFVAQFHKSNRGGPAAVYTIARGQHTLTGLRERLPRETDELRLSKEEIRAIAIRRIALMRHVVTQPLSPTSQDAYWNPGINIRTWTINGLTVITPKTDEHRFTAGQDRIHITAYEVEDSHITKVPSMTQPLWFGFTRGTVKGSLASEVWMSRYMELRGEALAQLESGDTLGVMNPTWKDELGQAGKLVNGSKGTTGKTRTQKPKARVNGDLMAQLMQTINF